MSTRSTRSFVKQRAPCLCRDRRARPFARDSVTLPLTLAQSREIEQVLAFAGRQLDLPAEGPVLAGAYQRSSSVRSSCGLVRSTFT